MKLSLQCGRVSSRARTRHRRYTCQLSLQPPFKVHLVPTSNIYTLIFPPLFFPSRSMQALLCPLSSPYSSLLRRGISGCHCVSDALCSRPWMRHALSTERPPTGSRGRRRRSTARQEGAGRWGSWGGRCCLLRARVLEKAHGGQRYFTSIPSSQISTFTKRRIPSTRSTKHVLRCNHLHLTDVPRYFLP